MESGRGSIGGYDPWGEDLAANPTNDTEKFATYTRDSATGLDYADQRYYTSQFGRFMSADPYRASGGPAIPASWNRYSYAEGDPANHKDPRGLSIDDEDDDDPIDTAWVMGVFLQSYHISEGPVHGDVAKMTDFSLDELGGAHQAIANLTGTPCAKELGAKYNLFTGTSSLLYKADSANPNAPVFYDARDQTVGNTQISSFGDRTGYNVADFFRLNPIVAGLVSGTSKFASNEILLAPYFFTLTGAQQAAILVHEILHSYTGLDDAGLATALGLDGITGDPSLKITNYLLNNCDLSKTTGH